MKKAVALLLASLFAVACSSKLKEEDRTISFQTHYFPLKIGGTAQLDPLVDGGKTHYDLDSNPWELKFEAVDPSVASVSPKGLITALNFGSTAIKVTGNGVIVEGNLNVKVIGETTNFKVMSFNTKVDDRSGTSTGWAYRRDGAVAMIKANAPDLIGMQEAQPHQITYLSRNLPDYKWYGLGRDTGNVPATTDSYAAEECMAIFYNTKSLEMKENGTFWLSDTPEKVSYGWDAGYRRTCTWARFTSRKTGKDIYFFNTHLDNSGSKARQESIKLIVKKMAEINTSGCTSYLTADFNSATTNAIFDPLKAVMKDARATAPDTDKHNTFHNYESAAGKSTIDHVWYAGADNTVLRYHTVIESYAGVQFVSDHYPVYGQFLIQ